jgi:hypothetical protein
VVDAVAKEGSLHVHVHVRVGARHRTTLATPATVLVEHISCRCCAGAHGWPNHYVHHQTYVRTTLCALPPMTYADRAPLFIYYDYSHISSPGATRTRADGMYRISMVKHALNQHGISFMLRLTRKTSTVCIMHDTNPVEFSTLYVFNVFPKYGFL